MHPADRIGSNLSGLLALALCIMMEDDMRNTLAIAALAALVAGPAVMPAPAFAKHHYYNQNGNYQQDRTYRGNDRYYRHHCGSGNGAVGTVAGGAGGALLGNALGGGTIGTVAGGVGGALLGRHLDKKNTKHRRGC